jgi:hypothetical protein
MSKKDNPSRLVSQTPKGFSAVYRLFDKHCHTLTCFFYGAVAEWFKSALC